MARTKRGRRAYSAGEWGRNRVRVFPDPKTGLLQIEWRENGRRQSKSLGHRDWALAKRQADEVAAGFAGPELNGRKEAEAEPLTLERLFDIYGEEVTPTKAKRTRERDRVAMRMFLGFLGPHRRPETLSRRDWDRFIRERRAGRVGPSGKARVEPNDRMRPEVSGRDPELGHEIQGRAGPLAPGIESAERLEDAQAEEPTPGRPVRSGIPGASEGVPPGRVAVSCRARARARNGTPHRRDPQASVVRYRHRGQDHPLARGAREDRVRAPDSGDRRGDRRPRGGAGEEPRERQRSGAALHAGSLEMREALDAPATGGGRPKGSPVSNRSVGEAGTR